MVILKIDKNDLPQVGKQQKQKQACPKDIKTKPINEPDGLKKQSKGKVGMKRNK